MPIEQALSGLGIMLFAVWLAILIIALFIIAIIATIIGFFKIINFMGGLEDELKERGKSSFRDFEKRIPKHSD